MTDYKHYKVIGETVDDAAGEAFDKSSQTVKASLSRWSTYFKIGKNG